MSFHRGRRALLLITLVGCSPELDWREFRPGESGVQLLMPCKPVQAVQEATLVARPLKVELYACSAAGDTWGLATADVTDPSDVETALQALALASRAPSAAAPQDLEAAQVPGATPFQHARRVRSVGRTADGARRVVEAQVFAVGTRVFQMSVSTDGNRPQAVASFMESARAATRP